MPTHSPRNSDSPAARPVTPEIKRLFLFFALAYFAQGISQEKSGMLSQVLKYYYKEHEHMTSTMIADFQAPLMIPWVIKPVYGLISDLFPLGRYRRKSYLFLTSGLAILGFLLVLFASGKDAVRVAIFCTSLGIAFGDVLVDALMVENGQKTGFLRRFQGLQWQFVSVAGILAALVGGQLSQHLGPVAALKVASIIAAIPMLGLIVASAILVREEPAANSRAEAVSALSGLRDALSSRTLWTMALILFLVNFVPNAGTAWYIYQTDVLKFERQLIGYCDALGSAGAVLGAWLFNRFFADRFTPRQLLAGSLLTSTVGTLGFLLVRNAATALPVALIGGILGMLALLAMLSLAGEAVPRRAEAFTFAALMSLNNQAVQWGDQLGARIFDRTGQQLWPLVLVGAATTLVAMFLIPLLPRDNAERRADGSPAANAASEPSVIDRPR